MTLRQNIINTLSSDLYQIQVQNGYLNNMKFVKNDLLLPEQVSMYPSCGFVIESDKPSEYLTEDLSLQIRKLIVTIAVYINEENKVLAIENMINDLNNLFKDSDSILPIYQSKINQVDGVWSDGINRCINVQNINQINESGIIIYKLSIYYLSEYDGNANGSSDLPIIPNILNSYSLSGHNHSQYFLNSLSGSLTSAPINLSGYALTSSLSNLSTSGHTHYAIPNNLTVSGNISASGTGTISGYGVNIYNYGTSPYGGAYKVGGARVLQRNSATVSVGDVENSTYIDCNYLDGITLYTNYASKKMNFDANGNLSVSGNTTVTGNIKTTGTINTTNGYFQFNGTNHIAFDGGVNIMTSQLWTKNILPNINNTYDIGSTSYNYRNAYLSGLNVNGNTSVTGNINIVGTGNLNVKGNASLSGVMLIQSSQSNLFTAKSNNLYQYAEINVDGETSNINFTDKFRIRYNEATESLDVEYFNGSAWVWKTTLATEA